MESCREATGDDVPRLAELVADAVAEQAEARGGAVWSQREAREVPADRSLREAIADDDQLVLAGLIDEWVAGYAVARVERLRTDRRLGVVTDIYVEPDAREVGVGEVLIDRVLDWCRERGCMGVDALALPGNRHTKNFFETFGFTARAIVVHRRLEPSP